MRQGGGKGVAALGKGAKGGGKETRAVHGREEKEREKKKGCKLEDG